MINLKLLSIRFGFVGKERIRSFFDANYLEIPDSMRLLLLYCSLFWFVGIHSSRAQVQIGVLGQVNKSNQTILFQSEINSPILSQESDYSLGLQVPVEISLQDWLSIRTGIRYKRLLTILLKSMDGVIFNQKNTIDYLEIPLQAAFSLNLKKYALSAGIGPYAAYSIDAKMTFEDRTVPIDWAAEGLSKLDFGVYSYVVCSKKLANEVNVHFELGYQLGLYDFNLRKSTESFHESTTIGIGLLKTIK